MLGQRCSLSSLSPVSDANNHSLQEKEERSVRDELVELLLFLLNQASFYMISAESQDWCFILRRQKVDFYNAKIHTLSQKSVSVSLKHLNNIAMQAFSF